MPDALRNALASIPEGRIEDKEQVKSVEAALMACWGDLKNSHDTSMRGYKIAGRIENITWKSPILSFTIERHGGTVNGSSRADRHSWRIDTLENSAEWQPAGYRQLEPTARPFKAAPVAEEIVSLILTGADDPRLRWKDGKKEVVVDISKTVPPGGSEQTMTSRRKRFRKECESRLQENGWEVVTYNRYRKVKLQLV